MLTVGGHGQTTGYRVEPKLPSLQCAVGLRQLLVCELQMHLEKIVIPENLVVALSSSVRQLPCSQKQTAKPFNIYFFPNLKVSGKYFQFWTVPARPVAAACDSMWCAARQDATCWTQAWQTPSMSLAATAATKMCLFGLVAANIYDCC